MSDTEIMAMSSQDEIMVTDKDLELVVAEASKRVEILRKVLGVAIKRTNPTDWVNQQGKPYLTASGAEKIAPLFGVKMDNLSDRRDEREDDKGKHYIYTLQARFVWRGGSIEAIGTCSSRDKFFSWDSTKREYKVLSEVDETNIKKAAYSNLLVNGITRVLGIRNLTWADLEAFGIKQSDTAKVEYQKGTSGGAVSSDTITEPQQKRIYALCKNVGWLEAEFKEWLKSEYNYDSTSKIKKAQYDDLCRKAVELKGGVYESK